METEVFSRLLIASPPHPGTQSRRDVYCVGGHMLGGHVSVRVSTVHRCSVQLHVHIIWGSLGCLDSTDPEEL